MGQEREQRNAEENRDLLALAKRLRDAASEADRPDVVAKIDEAILLLAGSSDSAGAPERGEDKTNVVLRILDGLGL